MNFIRVHEFTVNLSTILGITSEAEAPIRLWLKKSWMKWFSFQNDFNFFFGQVKYQEPAISFLNDGDVPMEGKYSATFALSKTPEVFTNLNEYEKRDARAGLLWAYCSGIRSLPFMVSTTEWGQLLLQARDFFRAVLVDKPDLILNKYTVEHLPRHIKEWHAAEDKRRSAETKKEWDSLKEGKDWWPVAKSTDGEWTLIRMCSPAALDLEAQRMHHCIDGSGYKHMLFTSTGLLLSLRRTAAISSPVASLEAHRNGVGITVVQFMKPCNIPVLAGTEEWSAFIQCAKQAAEIAEVSQKLLPLDNGLRGSANGDLEFTVNDN